jgi:hypothetical protein
VEIAAGDHKHTITAHSVESGEDVGGEVGAGDVAEVQGAVGVGPADGDEDVSSL